MTDSGPADNALLKAVQALCAGELVAIPTETVYGLAADAGNEAAVAAIYALKRRPSGHPLIVHVSSLEQARRWADFSPAALALARQFWPGPLTLIARRRDNMPGFACAEQPTVGLRVPSHPVAQELLQRFEQAGGLGVAAPSANRFGRISPTRAEHVREDYGRQAPFILEGGPAVVGLESTICDVSSASPAVLRPGAITETDIAMVLGLASLSSGDQSRPVVPGSLAAHYAPQTRMQLVPAAHLTAAYTALEQGDERVAVYSLHCPPGAATERWIEMPADAKGLSRALYDDLRRLDAMPASVLLVEQPPANSEYAAINDRLGRAQTGSALQPTTRP